MNSRKLRSKAKAPYKCTHHNREEEFYVNRPSSTRLCKAKANALPLSDRNRYSDK